ncbi:MAG: hypothetical protein ABSA30_00245, partial [Candidatus Aminicenantales bacterium]
AAAAAGTTAWGGQRAGGMRETARTAIGEAAQLGTTTDEASRLHGAGVAVDVSSHLQRSIAEGSESFKTLGLDARKLSAEPISEALAQVGEALNRVPNPCDRAAAAVDLFGKSGDEMIPILTNLRHKLAAVGEEAIVTAQKAEKTRAFDSAKKTAGEEYEKTMDAAARAMGFDESFGTKWERGKARAWSVLGGGGQQEQEALTAKWAKQKEDAQQAPVTAMAEATAHAAAEAAKKEAEAQKKLAEEMNHAAEAAENLRNKSWQSREGWRNADDRGHPQDVSGEAEYTRQAAAAGKAPKQITGDILAMRRWEREGRELQGAWGLYGQSKTASDKYREAGEDIATYRRTAVSPEEKDRADRMDRQRDKNYLKDLGVTDPIGELNEQLAEIMKARGTAPDARLASAAKRLIDGTMHALDEAFMTPMEEYAAHTQFIGEHYKGDAAGRRQEQEDRQLRSKLGVTDWQADFKKSMRELEEARGSISPEQYARREKELRRQAIGQATGELETVSPVAAMSAGSREAYSMMVQSQLNDPKVQLAQKTNDILTDLKKDVVGKLDEGNKNRVIAAPAQM